jgi:hypothetical protein
MEVNYLVGHESTEIHLQEPHPDMCLLSGRTEGPWSKQSESQNFHNFLLLPTGR